WRRSIDDPLPRQTIDFSALHLRKARVANSLNGDHVDHPICFMGVHLVNLLQVRNRLGSVHTEPISPVGVRARIYDVGNLGVLGMTFPLLRTVLRCLEPERT